MSFIHTADTFLSLGSCLLLLCVMAKQLVRSYQRPLPDRVVSEGRGVLLSLRFMATGYRVLIPAVGWLKRARVSPMMVTWFSLVPGAFAGIFAAMEVWSLAALSLLASCICDVLDGALARELDQKSARGALLDSTLDRYVEWFVLSGIAIGISYRGWSLLLVLAVLFGSMMVTYSTAKGEITGIRPAKAYMKRAERMTVLIVGMLLAPLCRLFGASPDSMLLVALLLICVLSHLSVVLRFASIYRRLDDR